MTYTSDYPIINVTVDLALFRTVLRDGLFVDEVLVIERGGEPFKGLLALPGGFLNYDEKPLDGAIRECREETGVVPKSLTFRKMLDDPGRDPRGRVISYLFGGWLKDGVEPVAGDDAAKAFWKPLHKVRQGPMAFDHAEVLREF